MNPASSPLQGAPLTSPGIYARAGPAGENDGSLGRTPREQQKPLSLERGLRFLLSPSPGEGGAGQGEGLRAYARRRAGRGRRSGALPSVAAVRGPAGAVRSIPADIAPGLPLRHLPLTPNSDSHSRANGLAT